MLIFGDAHGKLSLVREIIDTVKTRDVFFSGDLIDRGEDSRGVVELIIKYRFKSVRGDHEQMMIDSCDDHGNAYKDKSEYWIKYNGGDKTVRSYMVNGVFDQDTFMKHREWMKSLPLCLMLNKHAVLSHSRCLPYMHNIEKNKEQILTGKVTPEHNSDLINIHGHNVITEPITMRDNYINLDTGASSKGRLSAIDMTTFQIYEATE